MNIVIQVNGKYISSLGESGKYLGGSSTPDLFKLEGNMNSFKLSIDGKYICNYFWALSAGTNTNGLIDPLKSGVVAIFKFVENKLQITNFISGQLPYISMVGNGLRFHKNPYDGKTICDNTCASIVKIYAREHPNLDTSNVALKTANGYIKIGTDTDYSIFTKKGSDSSYTLTYKDKYLADINGKLSDTPVIFDANFPVTIIDSTEQGSLSNYSINVTFPEISVPDNTEINNNSSTVVNQLNIIGKLDWSGLITSIMDIYGSIAQFDIPHLGLVNSLRPDSIRYLAMSTLSNNVGYAWAHTDEECRPPYNILRTGENANDWKVLGVSKNPYTDTYSAICVNQPQFIALGSFVKKVTGQLDGMKANINTTIAALQTAINSTIQSVSDLKTKMQNQVDLYIAASAQLRQNIADAETKMINDLASIRNEYTMKAGIVSKKLVESKEEYENARIQLQNEYNAAVDENQKKFDTIKSELNSQITLLNTQIDYIRNDLLKAQEKYKTELENQKNLYNAEVDKLQSNYEIQKADLNQQISSLNSQKSDLENQLKLAQQKYNEDINKLVAQYNAEIAQLKLDSETIIAQLKSDYAAIKEKYSKDIAEYTALLQEQQSKTSQLKSLISNLDTQIQTTQDQLSSAKLTAQEQINTLSTEIETNYEQLKAQKESEFNEFVDAINQSQSDLITTTIDERTMKLKAITDELTAKTEELNKLENEYNVFKTNYDNEIADLNKQKDDLQTSAVDAIMKLSADDREKIMQLVSTKTSESVDALNKQVDTLKTLANDITKSVNDLTLNRDELKTEVTSYIQKRDIVEANYESVRDKLMSEAINYTQEILSKVENVNKARSDAEKIVLDQFLDEELKNKQAALAEITTKLAELEKSRDQLQKVIDEVGITTTTTSGSDYTILIVLGIIGLLFWYSMKNK